MAFSVRSLRLEVSDRINRLDDLVFGTTDVKAALTTSASYVPKFLSDIDTILCDMDGHETTVQVHIFWPSHRMYLALKSDLKFLQECVQSWREEFTNVLSELASDDNEEIPYCHRFRAEDHILTLCSLFTRFAEQVSRWEGMSAVLAQ